MSGTLPADALVLEKDAQEGVDAGLVLFFLLSRRSPSSFHRTFSFCDAAAVEKSKIQIEDYGDF